jgi:glutamyl/glutaminyl-tRNA synthetase
MVNFLALLGWNPGDEREIFSMEQLIAEFSLERCTKAGAIFNIEKLDWFSKEYLVKMPEADFIERAVRELRAIDAPLDRKERYALGLRGRIATFSEISTIDATWLGVAPENPTELILKGKGVGTPAEAAVRLQKAAELLSAVPAESWDKDALKAALWPYAEEQGKGAVLWPVRVSLSGLERSPDPFELAWILGREESLSRLFVSSEKLSKK